MTSAQKLRAQRRANCSKLISLPSYKGEVYPVGIILFFNFNFNFNISRLLSVTIRILSTSPGIADRNNRIVLCSLNKNGTRHPEANTQGQTNL